MKTKTTKSSIKFKTFLTLITFLTLTTFSAFAQSGGVVISIKSDAQADPSAILDVQDTTKGLLIPRMTLSQIQAIANPATGLLVFCTDDNNYYYFNGVQWISLYNQNNSDIILDRIYTAKDIYELAQFDEQPSEVTNDYLKFENSNGTAWFYRLFRLQLVPLGLLSDSSTYLIELEIALNPLLDDNGNYDYEPRFGISDGTNFIGGLISDSKSFSILEALSGVTLTSATSLGNADNEIYIKNPTVYIKLYGNQATWIGSKASQAPISGFSSKKLKPSNAIFFEIYKDQYTENYQLYYIKVIITKEK